MKIYFSLIILFFVVFSNINAQETSNAESYPTNFNSEMINEIPNLNGNIVAYDGIISQIEKSKNKTPFYKLDLGNGAEVWTLLMFNNKESKVGDTIRVVGYVTEASKANDKEKKYLGNSKHIVIAFGLIDFKNSNFLFLGGADSQKQEWIDGKIPSKD